MNKNVAVIGVGAVGSEILRILKQRNFPINKLRVFARRAREIKVDDVSYNVEAIENSDFSGIDIAFFAGTEGAKGASVLYAEKFIEKGAPFDAVGVGSSLLREKIDFTADVVMADGKPCAKTGRKYNANPRLEVVA